MKVFKILLIEDNEGDAILTLEAFKHVGLKCNVEVLTDGELALNYLNNLIYCEDYHYLNFWVDQLYSMTPDFCKFLLYSKINKI